MCRNAGGVCPYGHKCQYAHSPDELRTHVFGEKYKTEPCAGFHMLGMCPYGDRCKFQHMDMDRASPLIVRTTIPTTAELVDAFVAALDDADVIAAPPWLLLR